MFLGFSNLKSLLLFIHKNNISTPNKTKICYWCVLLCLIFSIGIISFGNKTYVYILI